MNTPLCAAKLALVLLASTLLAPRALAQTNAEIVTARAIATRGLAAYDAGDYETAAVQLEQAFNLVKVPTLAVYWARALEKHGKLIEAAEVYQEALLLPLGKGQQEAQEQAQADAHAEREKLLPRIPKLTVIVEGAERGNATFLLDGVEVSGVLVRAGYSVNPGQHTVTGRLPGHEVNQEVTLTEGASETVTLRFDREAPASEEAPPEPSPRAPVVPQDTATAPSDRGNWQRPTGFAVAGVGVLGLVVGGISGLSAKNQRDDLLANGCRDSGTCFNDQQDDVDSYNRSLTMTNVGLIAGGLLTAGGVALILTAPRSHSETRRVSLWVGLNKTGVQGRF